MLNNQLLIYLIEAFLVGVFTIFLHKVLKLKFSVYWSILLLFSTFIFNFYSLILLKFGQDPDIFRYLNESYQLKNYINQSFFKNSILLFLPGGNSYYPDYLTDIINQSNTYSHASFYFITRVYLFFSLLSDHTVYNISLGFIAMSITAKLFLMKSSEYFHFFKIQEKLLIYFLLLGGSDIYYVSSMLKETIAFFLLTLLIMSYKSNWKYKYILIFISISNLMLIRMEMVLFLIFSYSLYMMYKNYERKDLVNNMIITSVWVLIAFMFLFTPIYSTYLAKLNDFLRLNGGNTDLAPISNLSPFYNLPQKITRLVGIFFTPFSYKLQGVKYLLEDFYNIMLLIFTSFLLTKLNLKLINSKLILLLFSLTGLIFIAIVVPNFGAQIRYRSIYMIILIFTLIGSSDLNIVKKNI